MEATARARIAWSAGDSGPPLILLHGYPLDARIWAHQRSSFPRFARTVALDLPGFGTAAAEPVSDTMQGIAESVRTILEFHRLGPVTVLGHSFGGYVALQLYRDHPELFERLVLLSTRAEADSDEAKAKRLATAQRMMDPAERLNLEETVRGLVSDTTLQSGSAIVPELREIVGSAGNAAVTAALRAIAGRADHRSTLAGVTVPALAIWGESDRLIPPERTRALAEGIPGGIGQGVPAAGHLVPMEAPDDFERIVRRFLRTDG
ncbi:MAG: alpha/beta hydrolase [Thermoplasmata archaeon]|nr:alpha/beta hydrolase [Thermoplasmata archaeon]